VNAGVTFSPENACDESDNPQSSLIQGLEPFVESGDVVPEHHSHWACGWIDGFAIRVFDNKDDVTPAFSAYCDLQARLADYPILDEQDYSRREYDAAIDWIQREGRGLVIEDAPDDWPEQVFSWLWQHDERELNSCDDQGASPRRAVIADVLDNLGLLRVED
jgi:hypothetical protein